MAERVRTTTNVAKVLRALLADPAGEHYGYDLMRQTGLQSGALYPVLARLEGARWVDSHRESKVDGRSARRYYRLTPDGAALARAALSELHEALDVRPRYGFGRPEGSPA